MVESKSNPSKRRRVRIHFLPAPDAATADREDPLAADSNPEPTWLVEVTENADRIVAGRWELWHPRDLPSADTLKVMSIELELEGLKADAYIARVRDRVHLLVPDMPDEIFELLSLTQLHAIAEKAWRRPGETPKDVAEVKEDAANPPDGERGSASSSRSPLGSTAGVTPS